MRMLLVVPLMACLTPTLYPNTWQDIRQLGQSTHRRPLLQSIVGGGLMFIYLALLYVAIGLIPTGVAMALFFTYPVFTALFTWRLFGHRPSRFRWGVMGLVLMGGALTMPAFQPTAESYLWLGGVFGLGSGVAYALYAVNAQKSFETIHPAPFTWISFATTLGLSAACLLLWRGQSVELDWLPLWIGGLLSAIVTLAAHLLNNFGIRLIGAVSAAMISASNPALTVILAWFTIQERLNGLQLAGVGVVTLSIVLLSRDYALAKSNTAAGHNDGK
ncbi:MAG: DMT family transporter [Leptolyngbyaceae cyanobacterium MO_188.B28]|nr:DMT family transporter [Leptolyngbyaceae cyanobacterium MO_188.B28]